MIQFIRELADAANDRIRSPFIGSVTLVFLALNWRALAVLLFSKGSVELRILTFDGMTTLSSLIFLPAALGVAIALVLPWSKLLGAWIAKRPSGVLRRLQHDEAQQFRIYKLSGDAAEALAQAQKDEATERAKIDAAMRLEEARAIGPELEGELVEKREQAEAKSDEMFNNEPWEIEVLEIAALSKDGKIVLNGDGLTLDGNKSFDLSGWQNTHRDRKILFDLLLSMDKRGLLSGEFNRDRTTVVCEITADGYKRLER